MEENFNYGEQLSSCMQSAEAQQIVNNEENIGVKETESSQKFGKFKNADELYNAYQNLEAEFTKKSQRLKAFEKEQSKEADNTESVPAYEKNDWFKTVQKFYEDNPMAKGFEKEISEKVLGDKQLACSDSPLNIAWQTIKAEKFKPYEEIVKDNNFLDKYVLNNPEIQENVLKTYLESQKKAPNLISSTQGKQINISIRQVPKNLEQARNQVEKLFR